MNKTKKNAAFLQGLVGVLVMAAFLLVGAGRALAQFAFSLPTASDDFAEQMNPPPFDFSDAFYTANGISVFNLDKRSAARFGLFRLTGAPASGNQVNWVVDNSGTAGPTRNNIRILATTGGYPDDGSGTPTDFISLIAFAFGPSFFTGAVDARGNTTEDIVNTMEAYAAIKQFDSKGNFAFQPCTKGVVKNCFSVGSVATPNLRQNWRFASNRSRINATAPFGYFCDDLLGMWVITYFWFTNQGFGPAQTPACQQYLAGLQAANGLSLDGTPVVKTPNQLNNGEAIGCLAETQLSFTGSDGGVVWLVCPTIPDPRGAAITPDAFLDEVRLPNGNPLDPQLDANFNCLQTTGDFCPGLGPAAPPPI